VSKKARLRFELAPQLSAVEADLSQLHQVVMNLVINASDAVADSGGVISVTTGMMECDRTSLHEMILGDALDEGLYVYIEVADSGCGMDEATRARIFDPFYTTKRSGRGLGLAAVLGIVRAHHGAINLTSEAGRGSTFRVLLPASAASANPLPGADSRNQEWRGSGTVLLVDDEDTSRAVGRKMLELLGFTALTAANGPAAINLFRSRAADICGVILDLTMPEMCGDEVFPILRQIKPDIPVLLSSGYSEQELARHLDEQAFAGCIQKPYTVGTLAAKLRAALAE
jgi:CheY-like chemotaxis protein